MTSNVENKRRRKYPFLVWIYRGIKSYINFIFEDVERGMLFVFAGIMCFMLGFIIHYLVSTLGIVIILYGFYIEVCEYEDE